jgi:hypothetical protein
VANVDEMIMKAQRKEEKHGEENSTSEEVERLIAKGRWMIVELSERDKVPRQARKKRKN